MLDSVLTRDLEDADSPVELRFLANSETVEVYEGNIDVLECVVQRRFVVAVACYDGYVWQSGEFED